MRHLLDKYLNLGFRRCHSSSLEDVHQTADEASQQEEAARDHEANVVVSGRLKYPAWGTDNATWSLDLKNVFVKFTIYWRTDHWWESPEEGQEPEGAGEVVQTQQVHQNDRGEADVGGWEKVRVKNAIHPLRFSFNAFTFLCSVYRQKIQRAAPWWRGWRRRCSRGTGTPSGRTTRWQSLWQPRSSPGIWIVKTIVRISMRSLPN